MRRPTPVDTQRAEPAQPPYVREGAAFIPFAGAETPRLPARSQRLLARDSAIAEDAPERRRFWIFTGFVTEGDGPPSACFVVSQWQAAAAVDEVLTASCNMLRGADPAGGDAVTPGDVAAGASRGVPGGV